MPYIERFQRVEMDEIVETMRLRRVLPDGRLSYVLFKLCKDTVYPSYSNYKNFIGELNECAAEIRRRFLVPYEDQKCHDNGDVK